MDYYENRLKSKNHNNNIKRLINILNLCDICKEDINNSIWNRHVKKHMAILSNAVCVSHAGSASAFHLLSNATKVLTISLNCMYSYFFAAVIFYPYSVHNISFVGLLFHLFCHSNDLKLISYYSAYI